MTGSQRGKTETEGAIQQLYAAALDDARWNEALTAVAERLGSAGATLEIIDKASATPAFFRGAGLPDDGIEDYLEVKYLCMGGIKEAP